MNVMEGIYAKARAAQKTIVLPEGRDPRVVQAAADAAAQNLGKIIVVDKKSDIEKAVRESGADLSKVTVIDPETSPKLEEYAKLFYELIKSKGITEEKALETVKDPLYFGVMMVYTGEADGQVSGAIHSTADTVRPALQVLKCAPGTSIVSSFFVMIVPDCEYGEKGLFIYSDSGLVINPNSNELAEIAITSAKTMRQLFDVEPRVAMLSFSTKGSASDPLIDKVVEATRIAKERAPHLLIDGELQGDAALVPWIGERKAPGSEVAGKANVLIFPDLNAGNIAYKLTERLAKAEAYGPVLQGLRKPVNDLSRGCNASDIVNVTAITAVQAIEE
ncbi:MAG TPA: phosphate acetyltransferase [Armatimonadota bacterium]|nr:phosphate acetyltransferase [Armatimonadota bacterium]